MVQANELFPLNKVMLLLKNLKGNFKTDLIASRKYFIPL